MDETWLLDLGWSVFRHGALHCDSGGSAEATFREVYKDQAAKGVAALPADPATLGELLAWVSEAGRLAGMLAQRAGRSVSAAEVKRATETVALASDTTWC